MAPLKPIDDLIIQVRRLIGLIVDLLERYSRSYEELDSNRLAVEELRELLKDYFEEAGRDSDTIARRMDRLEQYIVLSRMGNAEQAGAITQQVTGEHIRRGLREELANQRDLLQQYQANADHVKIRIARFGETVPLVNELADYQREADKAAEAISRIQEALNK